jgi:FMN phosphatase YigB (HAD superfamily)
LTNWLKNNAAESYPDRVYAASLVEKAKAIIFDLDGTLYDSKHIALRVVLARPFDVVLLRSERLVRKVFEGRDYAGTEEYYREFFAAMGKHTGRSPEQLRSWYFEKYMPRIIGVLKKFYGPRPKTAELFGAFKKARFPFAVYSDYPLVRERLTALGLADAFAGSFETCYSLEDFGAQKPAARPFFVIAKELGCDPADVLVLGDREDTDGQGAAAAGMGYIKIIRKRTTGKSPAVSPDSGNSPVSLLWEELYPLLIQLCQPH